jgi:hypothetical protein
MTGPPPLSLGCKAVLTVTSSFVHGHYECMVITV